MVIVDAAAREVLNRACASEVEARTFASTVRQHVEWLSEPKFREYYRIGGSRDLGKRADRASGIPPAGEEEA